jgi:hypothetical protein
MSIIKEEIVKKICYTDLVYERINKKLNINFSKEQNEHFILKILKETDDRFISRKGKNYYLLHTEENKK